MAKKRKRAVSVSELLNTKFKTFEGLSHEWEAAIGRPEMRGVWILAGNSANGKTSCYLQLAKELTKFGKVLYNSLEEGVSESMKNAARIQNLAEVSRKLLILDKVSIEDLTKRLHAKRTEKIIIIDSLQYTGLNSRTFFKFIDQFPDRLFIFTSHLEGSKPEGRLGKKVWYHANVKGIIDGYKLHAISRGFETEPYVIWEKGAALAHGEVSV